MGWLNFLEYKKPSITNVMGMQGGIRSTYNYSNFRTQIQQGEARLRSGPVIDARVKVHGLLLNIQSIM